MAQKGVAIFPGNVAAAGGISHSRPALPVGGLAITAPRRAGTKWCDPPLI